MINISKIELIKLKKNKKEKTKTYKDLQSEANVKKTGEDRYYHRKLKVLEELRIYFILIGQ